MLMAVAWPQGGCLPGLASLALGHGRGEQAVEASAQCLQPSSCFLLAVLVRKYGHDIGPCIPEGLQIAGKKYAPLHVRMLDTGRRAQCFEHGFPDVIQTSRGQLLTYGRPAQQALHASDESFCEGCHRG